MKRKGITMMTVLLTAGMSSLVFNGCGQPSAQEQQVVEETVKNQTADISTELPKEASSEIAESESAESLMDSADNTETEETEQAEVVDFGEIYMVAVAPDHYVGFDTMTEDFVTYTPDPEDDMELYGSIDGIQCLALSMYGMSVVKYTNYVEGYTICGVYPGQNLEEARNVLEQNGFTFADSDDVYTYYNIPSDTPDVYYQVAYTADGDTIGTVSIGLWSEFAE